MNRMNYFKRFGWLVALLHLMIFDVYSQVDVEVLEKWEVYQSQNHALYDRLASEVFEKMEERKELVSKINTLEEWKGRQQVLRQTFDEVIGSFPEKTPLKPQIVKVIKKKNYTAEHIIFESQPGFYVTSTLYRPNGVKRNVKLPAIIYVSGHSEVAYRSDVYQHVILNLVNKGFVVFAFDPIGQGERYQYYDESTGKSMMGGSTREHSYVGAQAFVTGSSLAKYMVWDGIRAVDYLLTRSEVDPDRIGMTGRSGGGTQSSFIAAFDDRIYAVAPECYLTNYTRLFETIGSQDAEQNFLNGIAAGLDHPDFLSVRAPKPALMITTTNDMFSIQGAMETEAEVSRIYQAYGKSDNFSRVEDLAGHASTLANRESMYAFFQKHLNNPGNSDDIQPEYMTSEELQVTRTGQVATSLGGESTFSLNAKEAEVLRDSALKGRSGNVDYLNNAVNEAKRISGYKTTKVDVVYVSNTRGSNYHMKKYFLQSDDYVTPFLLFVPDQGNGKAIISLYPSGKSDTTQYMDQMRSLIDEGYTVLIPDLVGIGELGPESWGSGRVKQAYFRLWMGATTLQTSFVGIRASDVSSLVDFLEGVELTQEISGFASGSMSAVMLHAAAFDMRIKQVALHNPYLSYHSMATTRLYDPELLFGSVPEALTAYDLPELAASLAPRKMLIFGKIEDDLIRDELAYIKSVFEFRNVPENLKIIDSSDYKKPYFYKLWLK